MLRITAVVSVQAAILCALVSLSYGAVRLGLQGLWEHRLVEGRSALVRGAVGGGLVFVAFSLLLVLPLMALARAASRRDDQ